MSAGTGRRLDPSTQVYWDRAAETYDQQFTQTLIGRMRRETVWRDLDRLFHAGRRILELNCGTGIDAVHLAQRGVRLLACDISPRMVELARRRAELTEVGEAVDFRVLPSEQLSSLLPEGPFDGAFSNFAGLNCVEDLSSVARALHSLLRPGSPLLVCMLGRLVPWEIVWFLAHGRPRRAFQRLGPSALRPVEGGILQVQYPSVAQIVRAFQPGFWLRGWKGAGIAVPPSYIEHWACRFPHLTRALSWADRFLGSLPGLRHLADCVVLEFESHAAPRADP